MALITRQPSRKGKYAPALKNIQNEQMSKLQTKHANEADLLEDIRNFTRQRSALEKSYAEGLLKLSATYLGKKLVNLPELGQEEQRSQWNVFSVWKTLLDETEKIAKTRLAAVEVFQTQISDDAKNVRGQKLIVGKKCLDQLGVIHKEILVCIQELDKTKKIYFDEEHVAHDARAKAMDAEEKSFALSAKRDQCDEKATQARNDYILQLAAANAHQKRVSDIDLSHLIHTMECKFYEKVAEYLILFGKTELVTCAAAETAFSNVQHKAQTITRDYNWQCYVEQYPVLVSRTDYKFEPCDGDEIHVVKQDNNAAEMLKKAAQTFSTRIARETKTIKECQRKLVYYQSLKDSGQKVDPDDQQGPDIDTKIENLKSNLRRAETAKLKAEARKDALRDGGLDMEEYLRNAFAAAESLDPGEMTRSVSQVSMRSDVEGVYEDVGDSFDDSDYDGSLDYRGGTVQTEQQVQEKDSAFDRETSITSSDVIPQSYEESLEQEPDMITGEMEFRERTMKGQQREWQDPTQVDWGDKGHDPCPELDNVVSEVNGNVPTDKDNGGYFTPIKCIAVFAYEAQNPDELNLMESEIVEVIGVDEEAGEGWVRARDCHGREGLVPRTYLEVADYEGNVTSFSSVDYQMNGMQAEDQNEALLLNGEIAHINEKVPPPINADGDFCRAIFDYEALTPEELSFYDGQIIRILDRRPHKDMDDGWWKGELDGEEGLFPSCLVEDCLWDGEPVTPPEYVESNDSPVEAGPPPFSPPDIPNFLLPPDGIIITQPTPDTEFPPTLPAEPKDKEVVSYSVVNRDFKMELSEELKKHCQKDLSSPEESDVTDATGHAIEYSELVSSHGSTPVDGESRIEDVPLDDHQLEGGGRKDLDVAEIVITAATPTVGSPEDEILPEVPEVPEQEEEMQSCEAEVDSASSWQSEAVADIETKAESQLSGENKPEIEVFFQEPVSAAVELEASAEEPRREQEATIIPVQRSDSPTKSAASMILPEELDPEQLKKLEHLKESDA
ncbi:unnamed protein product [Darwinula stevensoni]|uniref:FCH and double SH3 domains protein 2 n=1 Tax=Darwinula stevensoni TaxID=69355 RepID=A0A7R8XG99_9CRUS|nr:unnamed protein product [Darwinula stevensoni]CAG0891290.1 unnamed protein product [Darwinula stevensoni]